MEIANRYLQHQETQLLSVQHETINPGRPRPRWARSEAAPVLLVALEVLPVAVPVGGTDYEGEEREDESEGTEHHSAPFQQALPPPPG